MPLGENYRITILTAWLIRPMYYPESERREAYEVSNEYYFGTEMIVCPITHPHDKAPGR